MDKRKHMGKDKMSGFSPRNIKYMRKFAQCWLDYEISHGIAAV